VPCCSSTQQLWRSHTTRAHPQPSAHHWPLSASCEPS
jgi:hypothetical protein